VAPEAAAIARVGKPIAARVTKRRVAPRRESERPHWRQEQRQRGERQCAKREFEIEHGEPLEAGADRGDAKSRFLLTVRLPNRRPEGNVGRILS
jgi:hypothetical protein